MKKSEIVEIIRGIIQEDLSEFIKPVIRKTILEELGLVLLPVVKKVMKEQMGRQNIVREGMLPVSDYRKKLLKDIGLVNEAPTLLNKNANIPQYNQQPVGSGLSGILSETLNDMRPGEMDDLGVGETYNPSIDLYSGADDFNDYGGGYGQLPANNFMDVGQVSTNTNSAISKLDETLSKDYSSFLNRVTEISQGTRGAKAMEVNMHQESIRSRINQNPEQKE